MAYLFLEVSEKTSLSSLVFTPQNLEPVECSGCDTPKRINLNALVVHLPHHLVHGYLA